MRRDSRSGCSLGSGDVCGRHIFEFVFFLILLEESLLRSFEMYSNVIAVKFDDVDRKLMSVNVFYIIVGKESLGDVVD